jgi:hypothetical protein
VVTIILTNNTQVTVPSGVLTTGRYALRIRAIKEASGDPVNAPLRRGGYPFGYADALSGSIVVP